jgi:polyisoprenoid-binding protein YceI
MKRFLIVLTLGTFAFASCQNAPKADKAEATEAQQPVANANGNAFKADLAQSRIQFIGTKPVGKHHGNLTLKDGQFTEDNGSISGGKFVIDVKTLKMDDQDSAGNAKLGGHLLSPDFFDAAKYPEIMFEITGVKQGVDSTGGKEVVMKDATHTVTGNLTMKGVSKSISFPAKIAMNGNQVTSEANFNIDRTQWNLSYGNDKSLGDHFIDPQVNIQLHIVANK